MNIENGDFVKVKHEVDKSISFFGGDTSIGEVVGYNNDLIRVKIGDEVREFHPKDIVGKVEKMSKSKM